MEMWKKIKNFLDYEISCLGRIRSYRRYSWGQIIKPRFWKSHSYLKVTLYRDFDSSRKRFELSLSHLMLENFVGPKPFGHEAHHIDGNMMKNSIQNLKWVTHSENCKESKRLLIMRQKHGSLKVEEVWLIKKLLSHDIGVVFVSRMFNVTHGAISMIKHGKRWNEDD